MLVFRIGTGNLGQEIGCSQFQSMNRFVCQTAHHYDGHIKTVQQGFQKFKPVHIRQLQIQDDHVGFSLGNPLYSPHTC